MKKHHFPCSIRAQAQAREAARKARAQQLGTRAFKRRLPLKRQMERMNAAMDKVMRYPTLTVRLDQYDPGAFATAVGIWEGVTIRSD